MGGAYDFLTEEGAKLARYFPWSLPDAYISIRNAATARAARATNRSRRELETLNAEDVAVDVKPTTSSEFPRPAKRPAFSILQNTRGPKMRSWQEALDEYIRTR